QVTNAQHGVPGGSEMSCEAAEAVGLAEGEASRVQVVILARDAAVKIGESLVGIFNPGPPMAAGMVFRAATDRPGGIGCMKATGEVTGLGEAGEADLGFRDRLEAPPITGRAHQAALSDEELVIGSQLVAPDDHGVAFDIGAETMPEVGRDPQGWSPAVDISSAPIA